MTRGCRRVCEGVARVGARGVRGCAREGVRVEHLRGARRPRVCRAGGAIVRMEAELEVLGQCEVAAVLAATLCEHVGVRAHLAARTVGAHLVRGCTGVHGDALGRKGTHRDARGRQGGTRGAPGGGLGAPSPPVRGARRRAASLRPTCCRPGARRRGGGASWCGAS